MKKLTLFLILLVALPTALLAQYYGGVGRGDIKNGCVNPTYGGLIVSNQAGCYPFNPALLNSTAAPTGFLGTLEYKWQQSTTSSTAGFTDIANSNSATYDPPSLNVTTWFKRLARVSCKTDWVGAATSNVLCMTVYALPNAPTGTDLTACYDGAAHTGSATAGAGETIVWYTASTGGSITTAPSGTEAGTYTAWAAAKNTTTGCESSTRTLVTVTINALPTAPTGTDQTACYDGTTYTGSATAGAGEAIVWYDAATGGAVTSAPSGTDVGTYVAYAAATNSTTGCESATRTTVTVTINEIPSAPTAVTPDSDVTIILGDGTYLNATSDGNTIYWYTSSTGGSPIGNSESTADYYVAPTETTTFYAESYSSIGCASAGRTATAVIIVDASKSLAQNSQPTDQTVATEVSMSNQPNPFVGSTTINYSLPTDAKVNLDVYNSLGKLVNTLVSEQQIQGNHSLKLDASNLPFGTYMAILKVKTENNESTRTLKLVINR
ncbi:MAG: T9SS type A sorting domain-containing protein [Bacteroidota bacterium]